MLGIRQRRCVFVGFDEELSSVAADDGEKDSDPAPGISSQNQAYRNRRRRFDRRC
jgi:hypothetical protein